MSPAERRAVAADAFRNAKARGDTRDQHHAAQRLQDATTALLRAEVRPTLTQRIISFLGGKHGT
jgi:hypothetical protein